MAGSMAEAIRAIRRLQPDIIVTEIMRPHDLGFISELHQKNPRVPILVFTTQEQALFGRRAVEAGACAYLMKKAGGEALLREVRALLGAHKRANSRRQGRWQAAAMHSGLSGKKIA